MSYDPWWFDQLRERCRDLTFSLDDTKLVVGIAWFASYEEPLRSKVGIQTDVDEAFASGLVQSWARYGRLTWKQRKVARRMVSYGMVQLELQSARREREKMIEGLKGDQT